jgi:adenine-specific DNA-methyltransferase
MRKTGKKSIGVEALTHKEAKRRNIPTAEFESVMREEDKSPVRVAYERRNHDLDPQLVWRGKDEQDWSDLIVQAPPLYIQEKVHPKVLIDDLRRESKERAKEKEPAPLDLFSDFNGLHDLDAKTEFYQHDQNWSNRMILGDGLNVMASLAERERLRGQVQCIYVDPPYGIRFNSNFQWSTTSRDVKDGSREHITREPEQVRAFRDTWRDGIHSYLTYLRDRLTVARDLLAESGSIFVQIGEENVHLVKSLLSEVFGEKNFIREIVVTKTSGLAAADRMASSADYILWFAKHQQGIKYRPLALQKDIFESDGAMYYHAQFPDGTRRSLSASERHRTVDSDVRRYMVDNLTKPGPGSKFRISFEGRDYEPGARWWGTTPEGMARLVKSSRLQVSGNTLRYIRFWDDFPYQPLNNVWTDMGTGGFLEPKIYVVQTRQTIVERCVLMTTDPGDLVLDPTCGSGTTAYVSEQWGRRWVTIDTSRVALTLARTRIMAARYPYYMLADSVDGQLKEAEITRSVPRTGPTYGNIRQGFVYERVPHITLKSIANDAEIDVIWEKWQKTLEPLRAVLNNARSKAWEEWDVPREADAKWLATMKEAHAKWWEARIVRQREMDASIAAKAEFEYLYDKPYVDGSRVRVAGPFTVESLSPHRVLTVGADDTLIDGVAESRRRYRHDGSETSQDFAAMILENLKASGVQQAHKEDRITFTALTGWPGKYIAAEGRFMEGNTQRRAGILIGPEFGTVSRPDLVAAAREAGDAGFDVLIACAFNYDAHAGEFRKLGRIPVLKARMNPELHMADDLKATNKGNLFVVFGEPDIEIDKLKDGMIRVAIKGVDVFKPQSGEIESGGPDTIALWMIDTDYNEESFFVRQAYFLGANDPYKALKTTLKAEIDEEAWSSLRSDTSRSFPKPAAGRIAVKVINHLGDEVMKVFSV